MVRSICYGILSGAFIICALLLVIGGCASPQYLKSGVEICADVCVKQGMVIDKFSSDGSEGDCSCKIREEL